MEERPVRLVFDILKGASPNHLSSFAAKCPKDCIYTYLVQRSCTAPSYKYRFAGAARKRALAIFGPARLLKVVHEPGLS